jgi:hypothetical protein
LLEVRLKDFVAGKTIGGMDLTTLVQRVTLTVNAVNDISEFTPGSNMTIDEDEGLKVIPWASGIRSESVTATDETETVA